MFLILYQKSNLILQGINVNVQREPQDMLNQEILTIKLKLDFSDDPFKTYTCQAKNSQGEIVAKKSMRIRN